MKESYIFKQVHLRGKDRSTGLYYLLLGDGLFSNIDYKVGDHIADYHGELIFEAEAERRTAAGKGGYMIYISIEVRMDCFSTCQSGDCKASKANSGTNALNSVTGRIAIGNATIVKSTSITGTTRVRLEASKRIPMHTEIITNYGRGFRYPST